MIAYKLVRKRKDGTYGPLFIDARLRMPIGEWMQAECHPRKGFAVRQGWHCTFTPTPRTCPRKAESGCRWRWRTGRAMTDRRAREAHGSWPNE
jgi:hypothetical protein